MSSSSEVEWDDVADIALMCFVGGGFLLTGGFYSKMEDLAKETSTDPRKAWYRRPLLAVARQVEKITKYLDDHDNVGIAAAITCGVAGIATGIAAMCFAGPWLGATWAGLLTLKGLGLGVGTFAIGAGVASVATSANSLVGLLAVPTIVQIARGWQDIKAEYIAGRAETREWKQEQKAARAAPHPLVTAAENKKGEMTAQGNHEREQLFRRLQAKFPDEFAEAVRRTDTDTVLRNKVQVMKQIKIRLQPKKKTFAQRLGGAA